MKTKVLVIGLAMAAFSTAGFAQEKSDETKTEEARKSCFVDKNNNDVCDNFEDGTCTIGTGKGLMDGTGYRQGLRDGSGAGRRDGSGNIDGVRRGVNSRAVNVRGARGRRPAAYSGRGNVNVGRGNVNVGRGNANVGRARGSRGYGAMDGTGNRSYRYQDSTGQNYTRPMDGTGNGAGYIYNRADSAAARIAYPAK
jgi:hypothetical protein